MSSMNNLKRSSLIAILITIVLHVIAVLFMNVTSLDPGSPIVIEQPLLELDFTEEDELEDPLKEEENQEKDKYDPDLKDIMQDINDRRKKNYKKYSPSELEEMVLKEIEERNKQSVEELRKNGVKGFDPKDFEDKSKTPGKEDKPGKNPVKENQYAGKVTKKCSMPGRGCRTGTPSYKCNSGGEVYINIKVDKIGRVKSATVNISKSTTSNQCILDEALKYAKKTTKAGSDLKGEHTNSGYIIYNFISQ